MTSGDAAERRTVHVEMSTPRMVEERGVPRLDLSRLAVSRGHSRTRTLQVRLSDQEMRTVERGAAAAGVPPSTYARMLLLSALHPVEGVQGVLDRIEADVRALRSQLVD